jgi:hypothetical protein
MPDDIETDELSDVTQPSSAPDPLAEILEIERRNRGAKRLGETSTAGGSQVRPVIPAAVDLIRRRPNLRSAQAGTQVPPVAGVVPQPGLIPEIVDLIRRRKRSNNKNRS